MLASLQGLSVGGQKGGKYLGVGAQKDEMNLE